MTSMTTLRRLAMGATALAALAPVSAWAGGYYLQEHSARGTGRAYSGEVADTGTDSLWWNPSAIAGTTGFTADIDASLILPRENIDNTGTIIARPGQAPAPVGGDATTRNAIRNGVAPAGAIAYGINDAVAIGLSVTAPYNFTTQYPTTSWARYSALRTSLRTIDIQPTLAFQPVKGVRIGLGWNIEHVSATLGNALPNISPLLPDGSQTLQGKGWDMGVSVGGQWQAGPLTLGATYKTAVHHKLNGTLVIAGLLPPLSAVLPNNTYSTNADFSTPWQAIFGARLAVSPMLTLNAQATRNGWSKFNAINLGAPFNTAIPEGYHNTWTYAGGIDAVLTPAWTLRAGIARDLSPVPAAARDARVPDSNRWVYAVGGSHTFSKRFTMDAGFQYLTFKDSPINKVTGFYLGTPAQTVVLTNGSVDGAHVFVFSLGGRIAL